MGTCKKFIMGQEVEFKPNPLANNSAQQQVVCAR
uniref:Uncharacterized protein n=1 Tax=Rhizophora mucronata TaxID=61149 RepID=A0A2P2N4T3_RHIMU